MALRIASFDLREAALRLHDAGFGSDLAPSPAPSFALRRLPASPCASVGAVRALVVWTSVMRPWRHACVQLRALAAAVRRAPRLLLRCHGESPRVCGAAATAAPCRCSQRTLVQRHARSQQGKRAVSPSPAGPGRCRSPTRPAPRRARGPAGPLSRQRRSRSTCVRCIGSTYGLRRRIERCSVGSESSSRAQPLIASTCSTLALVLVADGRREALRARVAPAGRRSRRCPCRPARACISMSSTSASKNGQRRVHFAQHRGPEPLDDRREPGPAPEPARQHVPALRPGEHPRDGAQRLDAAAAPRATRAASRSAFAR